MAFLFLNGLKHFFRSDLAVKNGLIVGLGNILNGDEGFGCYVLEALSNQTLGTSVQLSYLGEDPRWAGGLIYGADLMIVVGTLNLGEPAGRLYAWSYPVFRQHMALMANEYRRIRLLIEALSRAKFAGRLPKDFLFLWLEPQLTEGFGMSVQARKALWKTTRTIKQKLFENNLSPEIALTVSQIYRFEPIMAEP